jgi:hypothetical protein
MAGLATLMAVGLSTGLYGLFSMSFGINKVE